MNWKFNWLEWEKGTIEKMIVLHCNKKHTDIQSISVYGNKPLCNNCRNLLDYSLIKIDKCRFGNLKLNCSSCESHCYKSDMQEYIRVVMKYSGPRMIFYHPLTAILYTFRKI